MWGRTDVQDSQADKDETIDAQSKQKQRDGLSLQSIKGAPCKDTLGNATSDSCHLFFVRTSLWQGMCGFLAAKGVPHGFIRLTCDGRRVLRTMKVSFIPGEMFL